MKWTICYLTLGLWVSFPMVAAEVPTSSQTHTYVDEPIVGWHWYNEPQPEDEDDEPPPEQIPVASLSPTLQKKVMQALTSTFLVRPVWVV